MRKIFLITEGGAGIGFGHLSRCYALFHALREKGETPVFVINDDPAALSYLTELGVGKVKTRPRPDALDGVEGLEGDIAIVDSYRLPLGAYREVAGSFKLLISIDDENRLPYPPGFVVNGALYARDLPYEKRESVTYLLGPSYFLMKPEFANMPYPAIREEVKDILITVGGVDWRGLTERLIRVAGSVPGVTLHVLTTDGFENLAAIHETAQDVEAEVRFYHNAKHVSGIMRRCDIALSAGGQTTYELAACGLPAIGICAAANQLRNLQAWEAAGFLLFAGWENDVHLEGNLKECLKRISVSKARERMSMAGRRVMDGRGAARVAQVVLDYFGGETDLKATGSSRP